VEEPRSALSELQGVSLVRDQLHRSLHTIQQEKKTPEEIASGSDCRTEKCLLVCRVISYLHCGNTTYGKKLEKSRKELSTF